MLLIGSHVSFTKEKQLLGCVLESLSYGSNCFMFYTGAPQNTIRLPLNDDLTTKAKEEMKKNNIDINNIIVHAPYIVNLANPKNFDFSVNFLIQECKRCESLGITKLVLHPGSHVGLGSSKAKEMIALGLNKIFQFTSITILLETMAGKGTEMGCDLTSLKEIISLVSNKDQIGICLDTCHLNDASYDLTDFSSLLETLKELDLFNKIGCIHVNDSKNIIGSHKDRHANIGYGTIGFNNLINIIYHKDLENIPKILETPWINDFPPYKLEIEMIKNKEFNPNLETDLKNYYN